MARTLPSRVSVFSGSNASVDIRSTTHVCGRSKHPTLRAAGNQATISDQAKHQTRRRQARPRNRNPTAQTRSSTRLHLSNPLPSHQALRHRHRANHHQANPNHQHLQNQVPLQARHQPHGLILKKECITWNQTHIFRFRSNLIHQIGRTRSKQPCNIHSTMTDRNTNQQRGHTNARCIHHRNTTITQHNFGLEDPHRRS